MSAVRSYQKVINDNLIHRAHPRSKTYYNIVIHEISNLTRLSANAESKQNLVGTSGIQTLNIIEEPYVSTEDQTEYQVCYEQLKSKNISPSQNKNNQTQSNNKPNKITVLTRDQPLPRKRGETKDSVCMLCNNSLPTHQYSPLSLNNYIKTVNHPTSKKLNRKSGPSDTIIPDICRIGCLG